MRLKAGVHWCRDPRETPGLKGVSWGPSEAEAGVKTVPFFAQHLK